MTEVKCGWSACRWNTAYKECAVGSCLAENIKLSHIEVYNEFNAIESGMNCESYEENFNKFKRGR